MIPLFDEYQAWTSSTAIYPVDRAIEYVSLAIGDEIGELIEKLLPFASFEPSQAPKLMRLGDEVVKEAGDVMYYVAREALHLDTPLSEVMARARYDGSATLPATLLNLAIYGSKLQGRVKKLIRDGAKWSNEQVAENEGVIIHQLSNIVGALTAILRYFGFSIEHVMHVNRQKLDDRKARGVLSGSGDNR